MEMFLMGLCLSLLGVAVSALTFGAATRREREAEAAQPAKKLPMPAPQFFATDSAQPAAPAPRVPLDVLLLQIERHVRLEQAAAEAFLTLPTTESLHSRTTSPLVH